MLLVLTTSAVLGSITLHQSLRTFVNIQPSDDEWPMFRGNLHHTGFSPSSAPNTDTILWEYDPPINVWFQDSSPAIADGKIYMGACAVDADNPVAGRLYCLDENTGSLIWTYKTDSWVLSSPAVAEGKVYVGSFLDNKMHCIDANTGNPLWNYIAKYPLFSSPAVADEKIYFGCGTLDSQNNEGEILCLYANNGSLLWKYDPGDAVYSSPAVAYGYVYIGSLNGKLYCLHAGNGSIHWQYNTGSCIRSSPSIGNNNVFFGARNGNLYCLNAQNGSSRWTFKTQDSIFSSPALDNNRVYCVSYDKHVYCLDINNGNEIWNVSVDQKIYGSPSLADGKLYFGSGIMSPKSGKLFCVNSTTGTILWSQSFDEVSSASPAIVRGKVITTVKAHSLYCFCDNREPETPQRPSGPTIITPGVSYDYLTSAIDPDGDELRYGWDWDGDKQVDEWTAYYASGETVTTSHVWSNYGIKIVRVKSEDINGFQSGWSKPLPIVIPTQHQTSHNHLFQNFVVLKSFFSGLE